ncbi:unnamed protein product [Parnassius apollo]|uniref:(apollo) hypothetical protein n=1 Tax=Parnassius apollo TaxID=110799 RepID=A0A8S3XAN0_PARAO|nr:unnamed protein product [Parnassius apollo]
MRIAIFFLILAAVAWMGLSSPIDTRYKREVAPLGYRYRLSPISWRYRRSPIEQNVKGHNSYPQAGATFSALELKVKKGEYVCGNKICKLKPGGDTQGLSWDVSVPDLNH